MKNNIEQIIEEFKLSKEDLVEIDKDMHSRSSHLIGSDNWAVAYLTEFKVCVNDYLERKPKHL